MKKRFLCSLLALLLTTAQASQEIVLASEFQDSASVVSGVEAAFGDGTGKA